MADSAAAAGEAGICICCISALSAFCFLKSYGAGSSTSAPCGGPRGCCGSCLEGDPDEDSFERAQRKERERRMKKAAENPRMQQENTGSETKENELVGSQPTPAGGMQAPSQSPVAAS